MEAFFAAIRAADGRVVTFLVPASIRLLMTFAADALTEVADRIEFVETGAAPIMQPDMEQLCRLLPHARLFNTYASTETGIIATHNFNADHCQPGLLGRPMCHSHLHINADGRVVCSGDTLMMGYWDNAPHSFTPSSAQLCNCSSSLLPTQTSANAPCCFGSKIDWLLTNFLSALRWSTA